MIQEKLLAIQIALKAQKAKRNTFGNYNYRSCEDILEAVKPILNEAGCTLTLSDELVHFGSSDNLYTDKIESNNKTSYYHSGGDRFYIKATATLKYKEETEMVFAYAREEENKKGMDGSQITGASSSYARKYALGGLFLIDNENDSDVTNTHGKDSGHPETLSYNKKYKDSVCAKVATIRKDDLREMLEDCKTLFEITELKRLLTKEQQADIEIKEWFNSRFSQLKDELNG